MEIIELTYPWMKIRQFEPDYEKSWKLEKILLAYQDNLPQFYLTFFLMF